MATYTVKYQTKKRKLIYHKTQIGVTALHARILFSKKNKDATVLDVFEKPLSNNSVVKTLTVPVGKLAEFADWLHNNFYEPTGSDGFWKVNLKLAKELGSRLAVPRINLYSSTQLVIKFLKNKGEF